MELARGYIAVVVVVWILVFLVYFFASASVEKLKEKGAGKDDVNLRMTVKLNRTVFIMSLVGLVVLSIVYSGYGNLLPIPAEQLFPMLADGQLKSLEGEFVTMFTPLCLFFLFLVTAFFWLLIFCVRSRFMSMSGARRKYLKE